MNLITYVSIVLVLMAIDAILTRVIVKKMRYNMWPSFVWCAIWPITCIILIIGAVIDNNRKVTKNTKDKKNYEKQN